jgi:hypothetical protein
MSQESDRAARHRNRRVPRAYLTLLHREEKLLAGFLFRNLGAFFAGLGESDRNGLLSALHRAPFPAPARFQRPTFSPVHGALHALARRFSVSGHLVSPFCLKHGIVESQIGF